MHAVRNWCIGGGILFALSVAAPECRGTNMPDSIALDSLVQLYEKVYFDHAKHIRLIKDCAGCHHHTTGTQVNNANCVRCHRNSNETKTVACKGCHAAKPFSAEALREKSRNSNLYHLDKPGLTGAYHQSCLGCHARMGGPTGCQDCHLRKEEGDALYNTGAYAPKQAQGNGERHGH